MVCLILSSVKTIVKQIFVFSLIRIECIFVNLSNKVECLSICVMFKMDINYKHFNTSHLHSFKLLLLNCTSEQISQLLETLQKDPQKLAVEGEKMAEFIHSLTGEEAAAFDSPGQTPSPKLKDGSMSFQVQTEIVLLSYLF